MRVLGWGLVAGILIGAFFMMPEFPSEQIDFAALAADLHAEGRDKIATLLEYMNERRN